MMPIIAVIILSGLIALMLIVMYKKSRRKASLTKSLYLDVNTPEFVALKYKKFYNENILKSGKCYKVLIHIIEE